VTAVHVWRSEVHVLSTLWPIDHQRPKIDDLSAKCLIRTRSRFNPLKFDPGPSSRIAYYVHAQTGEAGGRADLNGRIVLKTDPQGTGWNGRRASTME
jgi:hypothetical protein